MANTIINTTRYANTTQMYLRSSLVSEEIARSQFRQDLYPGYTINFPYATDLRVQDYSYSTDLTIDPTTFVTSSYNISQVKAATANIDPLQTLQGHDLSPEDLLADQMGFNLARNIDQYVLATGITGATSTVAGGALSSSNMFETLTDVNATLAQGQARAGTRYVVLDPKRIAVLANTDKANGFQVADASLRNGFVGETSAGFKVFQSINLPYSVVLTMDTQPTNLDTFTLAGVTWTWVTDNTATNPGEIAIGTNVAEAKLNFVMAINGTGTPGTGTYIDVAVDTRRSLANMQLNAATFSGDNSTVTAYGKLTPSETFTAATNVFGTETVSFLAGVVGAIDMTIQSAPQIEVRLETKNKSYNLIGTCQYGAGVFYRDKTSLVKLTANA